MRAGIKHATVIGIAAALIVAGCGGNSRTSPPTQTLGTPSTVPESIADSTVVDTTAVATSSTGQAGDESTYATKAFEMPFDVTVPAWLPPAPSIEQPNFVTWVAPDTNEAVRFLIPVNVYPPDGTGTTSPPQDYVAYLLSQADHGAHFTDMTKTTVGDRPATIVTATVDASIDGSLGCPAEGMTADDCFGLQPDFVLRIAVIDNGDKTLLAWLRHNADATDSTTTEFEPFEQLLRSVDFSDRAVEAPAAPANPVATPLDGTYQWTITVEDALAHGTPGDMTPENLASFPSTFTITMSQGTWELGGRDGEGDHPDEGDGTYTVDSNQVRFDWTGNVLSFAFTVDDDGTLHLDPEGSMNDGDQFIWATKPWQKIG